MNKSLSYREIDVPSVVQVFYFAIFLIPTRRFSCLLKLATERLDERCFARGLRSLALYVMMSSQSIQV